MDRKPYDSYKYIDPDYQYTYLNTSVLKNKQNILNAEEARIKEYEYTSSRIIQLGFKPIEVKSMSDILDIHHFLFQDMYEWAGEYRKVNMSKSGHAFMAFQAFDTGEKFINLLISQFYETAHSLSEIAKQLAEILDNLNYMHPFREGNGRTQREVVRSLALSKGYYADITVDTNDDLYYLYMDGTVYGDRTKLITLFEKILEPVDGDDLFRRSSVDNSLK